MGKKADESDFWETAGFFCIPSVKEKFPSRRLSIPLSFAWRGNGLRFLE